MALRFPKTSAVAAVFGCSPDALAFYTLDCLRQVKAAADASALPIYATIPVAPCRHNIAARRTAKKQRRAQRDLNSAGAELDRRLTVACFDLRIEWARAA